MHSIQRLRAIAGLLALALAGALTTTPRAWAHPAIAGHAYINDNTAGTNTIGAFHRRANGSLVLTRTLGARHLQCEGASPTRMAAALRHMAQSFRDSTPCRKCD